MTLQMKFLWLSVLCGWISWAILGYVLWSVQP